MSLVITGTQRSGTSAIAKCLIESGYDLGTTWFDEEAQGGYEHPIICAFYRRYLGDPTFPFSDFEVPSGIMGNAAEFQALDLEVVKFSYLLMNPAFVYIWNKFRPGRDTFLVLDRNKTDVVGSKLLKWERFSKDSLLLAKVAEEIRGNFKSSLDVLESINAILYTLYFPLCLDYPDAVNYALEFLDPAVQITQKAWEAVIDKTKLHF